VPPLPEIEPGLAEPGAPRGDVFEQPLDSAGIDQLLGLYAPSEPGAPPGEEEWAPSAVEEEAAPAEEVAGVSEDMADLRALFAESEPAEVAPEMDELLPGFEEVPLVEPESAAPPEEAPAPAEVEPELQPEWVSELRPSDLPVTVKVGGAELSVPQQAVFDLPEPLRLLRESSLAAAGEAVEALAPEAGPLAGISGALPLAGAVLVQEAAAAPLKGVIVTQQQRARVERLQALLELTAPEEEAEVAPIPEPGVFPFETPAPAARVTPKHVRRRARLKIDRVIVSLALFIGLILPFASDALHFAADPAALSGDRQAVAGAVEAVTAGQYVLFAFEYGPTAAGELDPLAEAVLRDVLSRRAIPLTLSTNPAGALHVEAVIAPLVKDARLLDARGQEETAVQGGEDYVLLSYLPGETVGVRSLRTVSEGTAIHPAFDSDLRGDDTNLPVSGLEEDIALIVVIAETSGDVRTWAEQLQGVNVPKVALVTAALEPLAGPYVNQDGYAGYLAGVRDAYSYNAERNANSRMPYSPPPDLKVEIPDPEVSRWHSMALGAALAAGLIAVGMVINLFRALVRRRGR
jgi:hypothetical protein